MNVNQILEKRLLEKVKHLSFKQMQQVEEFIDSLNSENAEQALILASTQLSESSFNKVWDNPEDTVYDEL
ncbi:toxin-antitoxin system, antitoxin component, Xre family protein [Crocosphaera sp.]|uniref:toxin-antitoxin system, antitoxin component, Xre family protein n=1 Tax=Crocosphaera sp. TaxID=2729996 RepID=UPI003F2335C4|nr:toxin-antitoxin system, antitoxin component, Xre family protein [Crocosphaera sp.]